MRKSLLSILCIVSFTGIANAQEAYWVNSNGEIWRNSRGECWRTINWTEATALPECEGGKYSKPTPAVASPSRSTEASRPVVAEAPKPVARPTAEPAKQSISLNAKTMFASGKGELADASELDKLVVDLKKVSDLKGVTIEGYTDPIGDPAVNDRLSKQRADSVKAYLIKNGIAAEKITATGKGSANPVVEMSACKGKRGKALSDCLAPNRRIEVQIDGTITVNR